MASGCVDCACPDCECINEQCISVSGKASYVKLHPCDVELVRSATPGLVTLCSDSVVGKYYLIFLRFNQEDGTQTIVWQDSEGETGNGLPDDAVVCTDDVSATVQLEVNTYVACLVSDPDQEILVREIYNESSNEVTYVNVLTGTPIDTSTFTTCEGGGGFGLSSEILVLCLAASPEVKVIVRAEYDSGTESWIYTDIKTDATLTPAELVACDEPQLEVSVFKACDASDTSVQFLVRSFYDEVTGLTTYENLVTGAIITTADFVACPEPRTDTEHLVMCLESDPSSKLLVRVVYDDVTGTASFFNGLTNAPILPDDIVPCPEPSNTLQPQIETDVFFACEAGDPDTKILIFSVYNEITQVTAYTNLISGAALTTADFAVCADDTADPQIETDIFLACDAGDPNVRILVLSVYDESTGTSTYTNVKTGAAITNADFVVCVDASQTGDDSDFTIFRACTPAGVPLDIIAIRDSSGVISYNDASDGSVIVPVTDFVPCDREPQIEAGLQVVCDSGNPTVKLLVRVVYDELQDTWTYSNALTGAALVPADFVPCPDPTQEAQPQIETDVFLACLTADDSRAIIRAVYNEITQVTTYENLGTGDALVQGDFEDCPDTLLCKTCKYVDTPGVAITPHPDDSDMFRASAFSGPYDPMGDIQAGYTGPISGSSGDMFVAACTGVQECDPVNPRYVKYIFNITAPSAGLGTLEHTVLFDESVGRMWLNGHLIYNFSHLNTSVNFVPTITQTVEFLEGQNEMVWEVFNDDPSATTPLGENLFAMDMRFTPFVRDTYQEVVLVDGSTTWLDSQGNIVAEPAGLVDCLDVRSTVTLCDELGSFLAHTLANGSVVYYSTNGITLYEPEGRVMECSSVPRRSVNASGGTQRFSLAGNAFTSYNIDPSDQIRGISFWVITSDASAGGEVDLVVTLEDGSTINHTLPFSGSHSIELNQGSGRYESPIIQLDFTELDNVPVQVRFNTISERW